FDRLLALGDSTPLWRGTQFAAVRRKTKRWMHPCSGCMRKNPCKPWGVHRWVRRALLPPAYSNSTSSSLRPSTRPLTWWISHATLAFPFWTDLMVIWITPLPAAPLTFTFLLSDLPLISSTSAGLIMCVTTIDSPALTFTTLGSLSGPYSCFL